MLGVIVGEGALGSFSTPWGLLIEFMRRFAPATAGAAVLLFSFFVDVFDSFGVEERTDRSIEYLGGALTAPFYGGRSRIGQKAVSVVLVNEESAKAFGLYGWPLPYSRQADIIELIADQRPAAIFVDFTYTDLQRTNLLDAEALGEVEDFARRLRRVEEGGVPILLGPVNTEAPELAPLHGFKQVGLSFFATQDFSYRLRDPDGRPMAAKALFDIWCARPGATPCAPLPESLDDRLIALEWGFGASPLMTPLLPENEARVCGARADEPRWRAFLRVLRRGVFSAAYQKQEEFDPLYFHCPYFDTVLAHWMVRPPDGFNAAPFVTGRIVFVGADLSFLSDYAPTPLLGKAPGVTAHAMAFDNLIERGGDITRYPREVRLGLDEADVFDTLIVAIGLGVILLVSFMRNRGGGDHKAVPWSIRMAVLLVSGLTGAAVSAFVFHWPAVNIFSILAVGSVALYAHDLTRGVMAGRAPASA